MIKRLIGATLLLWTIGFSAGYASANSYQGIRYETTTGKVYEHMSGELSLAASTATWSTYTITLNGDGGSIAATSISLSSAVTATQFLGSSATLTGSVTATQFLGSSATLTGSVTANSFSGDGSGLTGVTATGVITATNTWTAEQTFARTTAFSLATATTVFSGYIDIGPDTNSSAGSGVTSKSVDCDAGLYVLYGGCSVGGGVALSGSYATDSNTWNCVLASSGDVTATVTCGRLKY